VRTVLAVLATAVAGVGAVIAGNDETTEPDEPTRPVIGAGCLAAALTVVPALWFALLATPSVSGNVAVLGAAGCTLLGAVVVALGAFGPRLGTAALGLGVVLAVPVSMLFLVEAGTAGVTAPPVWLAVLATVLVVAGTALTRFGAVVRLVALVALAGLFVVLAANTHNDLLTGTAIVWVTPCLVLGAVAAAGSTVAEAFADKAALPALAPVATAVGSGVSLLLLGIRSTNSREVLDNLFGTSAMITDAVLVGVGVLLLAAPRLVSRSSR
jgi:hypothetical protein